MPFMPFHFGPGALVHCAAPGSVSFLAFCGANVLVDFEPLHFMLTQQEPIHRFSDANPLLGAVSFTALHLFCLLAGVAGVAVVGVRRYFRS